jgi:RHS repeat-associated protein
MNLNRSLSNFQGAVYQYTYNAKKASGVCLQSTSDYSPFGVLLDGRTMEGEGYRYGFNGMEKDDEVKGKGNSYDFGSRMYDSRVGKWLTIDPFARKLPTQSPFNFCLNDPLFYTDPDGEYPIITITKQKTGKTTLQRVIGITGTNKTQYTRVDLYTATVTDTEDKNFKMTFSVTRDAFVVNYGDDNGSNITLTNVAFEPKDGNNNHYIGKVMPAGFPKGNDLKALKLTQNKSETMHAEENEVSVELGYRDKSDVAKGIMLHVGAVYQRADGTISTAASEGCFGICNETSSSSKPSNEYSNEVLGKIISQANKSKTNYGKIEVIIQKRSKSERILTKTQKKAQ